MLGHLRVFWDSVKGQNFKIYKGVLVQHFGAFWSISGWCFRTAFLEISGCSNVVYWNILGHLRVSVVVPGWCCISVSLWSILGVPGNFEILWAFSECLGTSQGFGAVF